MVIGSWPITGETILRGSGFTADLVGRIVTVLNGIYAGARAEIVAVNSDTELERTLDSTDFNKMLQPWTDDKMALYKESKAVESIN